MIFDRSYDDQAILPQVSGEAPEDEFGRRHERIVAFERLPHDAGTMMMKFFLHVSNEVRRKRLEEEKRWWKERIWRGREQRREAEEARAQVRERGAILKRGENNVSFRAQRGIPAPSPERRDSSFVGMTRRPRAAVTA